MQQTMDAHLKDRQSKHHDQGHLYNQDKQLSEDVGQENLKGRHACSQAPVQETFLLLNHKWQSGQTRRHEKRDAEKKTKLYITGKIDKTLFLLEKMTKLFIAEKINKTQFRRKK